jgi:hypothetical protein
MEANQQAKTSRQEWDTHAGMDTPGKQGERWEGRSAAIPQRRYRRASGSQGLCDDKVSAKPARVGRKKRRWIPRGRDRTPVPCAALVRRLFVVITVIGSSVVRVVSDKGHRSVNYGPRGPAAGLRIKSEGHRERGREGAC